LIPLHTFKASSFNMAIFYRFPIHGRMSSLNDSRAAKIVRASAETPEQRATSVDKIALHHSAGTALRCHHLETADGLAPISEAMASREAQSSISVRNESKSTMRESIRQIVLNAKDNLSADALTIQGHNVLMSKKPPDSEFKLQFLARTAYAREKAGYTQETMAAALGMDQSKYSKYEIRTVLPHHLVVTFCSLCEVSLAWLYTAAVEVPAAKPKRRRRPKRLKAA